jgi:hypothetical protein
MTKPRAKPSNDNIVYTEIETPPDTKNSKVKPRDDKVAYTGVTTPLRVQEHPYSRIFFLKNRDSANYVLNKDFFFWSIIGLYLFLIWYYVLIFKNYEFLNRVTPHNNEGGVIWYFSAISAFCLFFVMLFGYYQKISNVYPLLGLGYSLLLISMGVLFFTFNRNEIERGFENDPVQVAYVFLLLYSFVSFFLI